MTYGDDVQLSVIEGVLNIFTYAEKFWGDWEELESAIAQVDYEHMTFNERELFIEFLCNACIRIWRNTPKPLNKVEEFDIGFFINNYDWNAFKFARSKGAGRDVTTHTKIAVAKDNLSKAEIKWLKSKCG